MQVPTFLHGVARRRLALGVRIFEPMSSKKRFQVYVAVGTDAGLLSSTWQLWAHRTSFYLTNEDLGGLKISLHGLDLSHPSGAHFRVEPDPRSGKGLRGAGALGLLLPQSGWPLRFSGVPHPLGVHAIRIRTTPAACTFGEAPTPMPKRSSSVRMMIPPPPDEWAADLDFVFGQVPAKFEPVVAHPQWVTVGHAGSTIQVGHGQSGFTLHNEHGVILRGDTHHRDLRQDPTPTHLQGNAREDGTTSHRAVQIDVDQDGILWLVEQVVGPPSVS